MSKYRVMASLQEATSKFDIIQQYCGDDDGFEGIPTFKDVGKYAPTVSVALQTVRQQIQLRKDDQTYTNIDANVEGCKLKAACLAELYLQVILQAAHGRVEYYRTAVRGKGHEGLIETLMKDAMEHARLLLTVDDRMKKETEPQLKTLNEAITEVAAIPPSLQDERPALGIHNHGPGAQNVNTGYGTQNNNNGNGPQINGGAWHGTNHF